MKNCNSMWNVEVMCNNCGSTLECGIRYSVDNKIIIAVEFCKTCHEQQSKEPNDQEIDDVEDLKGTVNKRFEYYKSIRKIKPAKGE